MILPIFSAILGILAFLPLNLWPIGFIYLAPLFLFFIKENLLWRLLAGVFIFRIIFSFGAAYFAFEPIIWIFSFLLFLGLAIAVYTIKKSFSFFIHKFPKYQFLNINYFLLFLFPFIWTSFDYLMAQYSLLPVYIMTAGNSLGSSPFLGLSAFGGPIFLIFFAAVINTLFTIAIIYHKSSKKSAIFTLVAVFIIFISWQISDYQLNKNSKIYQNLNNSINIAVISANEKFNYNELPQLENELTGKKIDLLILGEDVFDSFNNDYYFQTLKNLAKRLNVNLLATFDTFRNNKKYNSTILFNNNGEIVNISDKNRLTFAGEYWPFGSWRPSYFNWLKEKNPRIGSYAVFDIKNSYSAGSKKIFSLTANKKNIDFVSLICLEIHYPFDLKKYKKMGVNFIVNPTSNRWVGYGLNHYLYLTNNLRKIESIWLNITIISVGVRDFAGIITPDGKNNFVNFEKNNKNYGIFIGEIKY